ncbi:ABC transporter substrate-binding protein [Bacillaceae bacterium]
MKRISFWCVLVGIFSMLLVAGCSSPAGDEGIGEKPTDQSSGQSGREELILAVGKEPDNGFDPTTGWGRFGSPLFQSTLFKRNHDMKIVNDLATGYEVSRDGTVWTVKIRRDVKFSDGKPLTAADVQYTFETAAKSGSVVDLQTLKRVEAVDRDTVKFTLKEPRSTFIHSLVTLGIVPRHAHDEDYAENPIGSGPYKLVQWDKGQQLIVEANPYYYGAKPFFKKLTFLFLSEDAAFAAAKAGKVDVAYIPAAFSKEKVPGMRVEAIRTVDNRGIMFPYVKAGAKTEDGKPVGNDVTADAAIRRAINIAIDRQALVEGVLDGHGTPAYTVNDRLPWWNPEAVIADGDMDTAKRILEEAGWKDRDGDGIREKGSLRAEFPLLYPANDVTRQSLAIAVSDMIKPLGIHIQVEGKSWDEIKKLMHANAVLFGWGSHDPAEMYYLYSSKYAGIEFFNPGFYRNPTVDAYMEKAMAATDPAQALEYWKKAQWDGKTGVSAKGDAPWAWLVNLDHLYLVKDQLDIGKQKIHPHGHGWPITDNMEEWRWRH